MHEERRSGRAQPLPRRPPQRTITRASLPVDVTDLPPSPPAFHELIAAGCRAWGIALDARRADAIDAQARLLLAWTAALNLTAIRDPERVALLHVLDSLAAVPLLRREAGPRPRLADIGSGGGYPGLPLSVVLPASEAVLIESVGKKARFLAVAAAAVGRALGGEAPILRVEARRAEAWPAGERGAPFDVVTARAVASMARLAAIGLPLLRPGGLLVAWKSDAGDGALAAELHEAVSTIERLGGAGPWIEPLPEGVAGLATHRLVVVTRARRR
ncbi:MAG TPA: RsmG family class I SAM-dependent methyltransferase [Candidatus Sulfotelmatobacter sp.]|nr:RsmG family class I SAM-dependent methyltransferase [Candidatus Sulfotelmatobacter sp.]